VNTLETVAPFLRAGQIIALESTTYPGTTREEVVPRVERVGLSVGDELFVVYSPEREDPGNREFSTGSIPKIVGGQTASCLEVGVALYQQVIETVVEVSSPEVAEMAKLLENIHRAVNIGLVNEMKIIADKMGIDIFEVVDAAGTKPFGFTPYYPGPGIGGHCIPIDPFYLTWKAREFDLHTRFIELSGEINGSMPSYVVQKLKLALNEKCKALNSAKILVLGVAYKRDVDDMRESPAVKMMELMRAEGADVHYSDPHVPVFPHMRNHSFDLKSVDFDEESLQMYDAVLLATDHSSFDYEMIQSHSALVVDSRGVYRDKSLLNIVSA
jgi:UDP-N-acetyl-D-glucosamine dehydrogenase